MQNFKIAEHLKLNNDQYLNFKLFTLFIETLKEKKQENMYINR